MIIRSLGRRSAALDAAPINRSCERALDGLGRLSVSIDRREHFADACCKLRAAVARPRAHECHSGLLKILSGLLEETQALGFASTVRKKTAQVECPWSTPALVSATVRGFSAPEVSTSLQALAVRICAACVPALIGAAKRRLGTGCVPKLLQLQAEVV